MKFILPLLALASTGMTNLQAQSYEQRRYSYNEAAVPGPPIRNNKAAAYTNSQTTDRYTAIQVQKALAKKGYYNGAADGILGQQSREAILHYQRAAGLKPTGAVNESLLSSLRIGAEPVAYQARRDTDIYVSKNQKHRLSIPVQVQSALAEKGFYSGSVDGQIGPRSQEAIRRYQRSRGLRSTGIIDESLLRALRIS
jgi:peptidoglycan hydrolase-like protein with peptidoglycan-binding domain